MSPETEEVLAGTRPWWVEESDCLAFLRGLTPDSLDLVFGSPPYEDCRTYSVGFDLKGQAWVDWMVEVYRAATAACKGLVCFVLEGKTEDFRWSATPALLMADLHRAGFHLRKPPLYRRVGFPGSGGPDWLRNFYEFVVCVAPAGKLRWSDNTAMGHPPKWAPGGEMSYRLTDGSRVNQWGARATSGRTRRKDGSTQEPGRPSHATLSFKMSKRQRGKQSSSEYDVQHYDPPAIANPGNIIECGSGGNQIGDELAHESEAPFPEKLAEFFVRSFCPPGGLACDPFSGSGTTCKVAARHGRRFLGCDLRASQVELTRRRMTDALKKDETLPPRESDRMALFGE